MKIFDMDAHPPLTTLSARFIGELDAARFFGRLDAAGIDEICGTLTPPDGFFADHPTAEAIRRLNHGALELAAKNARYHPAAFVHPDCPEESMAAISAGAHIIGGIRGPWLSPADAHSDAMAEILGYAEKCGAAADLSAASEAAVTAAAERFPKLRILCGGRSGSLMMQKAQTLTAHPNVYLNVSSADWNWNYILHERIATLPAERLFFGSGYPHTNPAASAAAVKWELRHAPESVLHAVFHNNAAKLLGGDI